MLTGPALAGNPSPVADSVEKSDLPSLRTLLKKHAEVNAPQPDGMTALHWAAYHGELEAAKILLANKADVAATNRYGIAPLSLACQNGNGAIVELLLKYGAMPNTTLRGGETV
jgi:ankyrin repeat protein